MEEIKTNPAKDTHIYFKEDGNTNTYKEMLDNINLRMYDKFVNEEQKELEDYNEEKKSMAIMIIF